MHLCSWQTSFRSAQLVWHVSCGRESSIYIISPTKRPVGLDVSRSRISKFIVLLLRLKVLTSRPLRAQGLHCRCALQMPTQLQDLNFVGSMFTDDEDVHYQTNLVLAALSQSMDSRSSHTVDGASTIRGDWTVVPRNHNSRRRRNQSWEARSGA